MEERRGVLWVYVGKPEGKRPPGRSRCRWEDNIKMELQEVGCVGMYWIEMPQDSVRWRTVVYAFTDLQFSGNARTFLTS